MFLSDFERAGANPVYEHYHAGLQDGVHLISLSQGSAAEKLRSIGGMRDQPCIVGLSNQSSRQVVTNRLISTPSAAADQTFRICGLCRSGIESGWSAGQLMLTSSALAVFLL
eukprot:2718047-Amphidinium_carterae.1